MGVFLQHASEVYAFVYFGVLAAVCLLEWAIPLRPPHAALGLRWLSHVGLAILNTFIVRAVFPVLGIGWALVCAERGWGLFNNVAWPAWIAIPLCVAWLDFLFYIQHAAMHHVPFLWRAHRTHHTDQDFDFTTGLRSHPLETLLTTTLTLVGIGLAGASPLAVLIHQASTIAFAFIGHANVHVHPAFDRALRVVMVTPDMHRVHHSVDVREGTSNFSNLFPWWDYLFRTYLAEPRSGQREMALGVRGFEDHKHLSLQWMLAQPFLSPERPGPAAEVASSSTEATGSQPSR